MAPTDYRVATAAELLGMETKPKRTNRKQTETKRSGKAKREQSGNRDGAQSENRGTPMQAAGGELSGEDVTRRGDGNGNVESSDIDDASQTFGTTLRRVGKQSVVVVVESAARVKQLKSQEALPLLSQRTYRDHLAPRIDTSSSPPAAPGSSASSGVSRNGSKKSRCDSKVVEIYFSPVDVNRSRISFTDPLDEPEAAEEEEQLTPTQERYDDERRWADAATQQPEKPADTQDPAQSSEPKLMLEPEQVDRLVKALAECPLLHVHVSRQWWDDVSDVASVRSLSDETPSLTTASSDPSSLNSQASKRSPSLANEAVQEEFTRVYPDAPKARGGSNVAKTEFGGIAVVDAKIHGSPIRFISPDYRLGTSMVKVGQCSYMDIPYGTTMHSQLRIEPPSNRSINSRVMLQVINHVLERKSGRKAYLLVAELDVTESFTKAALMELSSHSGTSLTDLELIAPGVKAMPRESQIDWCALADELQTECALRDAVEDAAASFARLTTDSCTMQTLTLMSELERLKARHRDFLLLRPTGHHDNGMLSGVHIPWTSQHLDQILYEASPDAIRGEASKAARLLRDRVAAAVAEGCLAGTAFDSRIWWGDQMRLLHCVPLLEGLDNRPAAWAAFLSGKQSQNTPAFVRL